MELCKRWFEHQLGLLGYGKCALGTPAVSQRERAVYWHGTVDAEVVARRLLRGAQREAAERAIAKGFELVIEPAPHHPTAMTVVEHWGGNSEAMSAEEACGALALAERVEHELGLQARRLARERRRLVAAGIPAGERRVVRRFATARFELRVIEHGGSDFALDCYDARSTVNLCRDIIAGLWRYFNVTVELYHDNALLDSQTYCDMTAPTRATGLDDAYYRTHVRLMVGRAVLAARQRLHAHAQAGVTDASVLTASRAAVA